MVKDKQHRMKIRRVEIILLKSPRICACGGEYCKLVDLVVDIRSKLVKIVAALIVRQKTYRNVR